MLMVAAGARRGPHGLTQPVQRTMHTEKNIVERNLLTHGSRRTTCGRSGSITSFEDFFVVSHRRMYDNMCSQLPILKGGIWQMNQTLFFYPWPRRETISLAFCIGAGCSAAKPPPAKQVPNSTTLGEGTNAGFSSVASLRYP